MYKTVGIMMVKNGNKSIKQFLENNSLKTIHRRQLIEDNSSKTIHRRQCIENNSSKTIHWKQFIANNSLNYNLQLTGRLGREGPVLLHAAVRPRPFRKRKRNSFDERDRRLPPQVLPAGGWRNGSDAGYKTIRKLLLFLSHLKVTKSSYKTIRSF